MPAISIRPCLLGLVTGLAFMSDAAMADVPGVAAGIPEAERRNVIVNADPPVVGARHCHLR